MSTYQYRCAYMPGSTVDWSQIEGVKLVDTVDGAAPRLQTTVRMCRTNDAVLVRFECEDDYVVASYERRDDPLYKEDVVELFIDEEGAGRNYKEYEFSPRNVIFDALIEKKSGEPPIVHTGWDDLALRTAVSRGADGTMLYDIALAPSSFGIQPAPGVVWRMNMYRIDQAPDGRRHYWAWSPTGAVNFHRPETFGSVIFE